MGDCDLLKEMFAATPDANLAAVPGPENVVVDIDIDKKKEINGFPAWSKLLPNPPPTLVAKTPSGGKHFWFQTPIPLKNTTSSLASGIDTRGENGYAVLPPSSLPQGTYEWISPMDSPIAIIPVPGRAARLAERNRQRAAARPDFRERQGP